MRGPDHLWEGKRLLAECSRFGKGSPGRQAVASEATAHLLAALTAVLVADRLPEHVSWQEASDA